VAKSLNLYEIPRITIKFEFVVVLVQSISLTSFTSWGQGQFKYSYIFSLFEMSFKDKTVREFHPAPKRIHPISSTSFRSRGQGQKFLLYEFLICFSFIFLIWFQILIIKRCCFLYLESERHFKTRYRYRFWFKSFFIQIHWWFILSNFIKIMNVFWVLRTLIDLNLLNNWSCLC